MTEKPFGLYSAAMTYDKKRTFRRFSFYHINKVIMPASAAEITAIPSVPKIHLTHLSRAVMYGFKSSVPWIVHARVCPTHHSSTAKRSTRFMTDKPLSEFSEKQIALHLLDFSKVGMLLADDIIRHQRNAVVIAALAVVEIPFAAEIRAPVRQKMRILLLHTLPYDLPLAGGIVQGNFTLNFPFAGF